MPPRSCRAWGRAAKRVSGTYQFGPERCVLRGEGPRSEFAVAGARRGLVGAATSVEGAGEVVLDLAEVVGSARRVVQTNCERGRGALVSAVGLEERALRLRVVARVF